MQVDSNVVTKDDLSYLNNQVIWNESGSVIVESESDSSDEEDLIDDGKGNGKENLESLGFLKAGSVINSINLEPSILGDGKKINKGVVDGKIGYDREQVELGIDTKMQPFVGVLKGKVHRGKIDVKFMPQVDGNADGPVIIPIENLKKASLPYSNTLCGYLLDKRISFPAVQKELKRIWRNCGLEDMFMNSKGFFFFKFSDEVALQNILDGSPWILFDKIPLFLQRWRPGLTLTKNSHDKIPVWVKIFDLPLEVWSGEISALLLVSWVFH